MDAWTRNAPSKRSSRASEKWSGRGGALLISTRPLQILAAERSHVGVRKFGDKSVPERLFLSENAVSKQCPREVASALPSPFNSVGNAEPANGRGDVRQSCRA